MISPTEEAATLGEVGAYEEVIWLATRQGVSSISEALLRLALSEAGSVCSTLPIPMWWYRVGSGVEALRELLGPQYHAALSRSR